MKKETQKTTPKGKKEVSIKDSLTSKFGRGKVVPDKKQ